ncbi:MAG: hypothetical protein O3A46_09720, partial [Candidatus Poribacteria bacterium]|nr:hypothetical protein [Candidatus Poribacteria bacterium]
MIPRIAREDTVALRLVYRSLYREQREDTTLMRKRALLIGSILSLGIGLVLPVTEFWIQGTRLGLSSATPAAFFLFFVLVVALKLIPGEPLSRADLFIIMAMMMVATVIPTRGFGGSYFGMTTGPTYYATPENEWDKWIAPHLSDWIVVTDPNAVKEMYEGVEGGAIRWAAWAPSLAWWGVFVLAMTALVVSTLFLLQRTWIEQERLVFPIAQVVVALAETGQHPSHARCAVATRPPGGGRGHVVSLFRQPLFWAGFLVPAILESMNTLHFYFPQAPPFRLQWVLSHSIPYMTEPLIRVNFLMLGFAYFVESQLSFSLWAFFLLSLPLEWVYGRLFQGHAESVGPWTSGGPAGSIMAHQQMGAMLVLVVTMAWAARKNIAQETRLAAVFVVSAVVLCVMVWMTGVPAWVTPLVIGSALVIWLSLTRLMAQAGIATMVPAIVPLGFVTSAVGAPALGTAGLIGMGLTLVWSGDLLTYIMAPAANGIYLQRRGSTPVRSGFSSLIVAAMVSLAGCYVISLYLTSKYGGLNLQWQYFQAFPTYPGKFVETKLLAPTGPFLPGYFWTAVGAAAMLGLTYLHRGLMWWPLHPLGFLAQGGWIMNSLWV